MSLELVTDSFMIGGWLGILLHQNRLTYHFPKSRQRLK